MLLTSCVLASPFDQLAVAMEATEAAESRTPQPTFTVTSEATDTPTVTPTPTLTPFPTDTPTPPLPTETATPLPTETPTITPIPSETPTSPPPPPTDTPAPTEPPPPSWDYQVSEIYSAPTNATILSIIVAVQSHGGDWIGGYRVVGVDPNGVVTKSEPSASDTVGHTPSDSQVVKSGNTKFEPQPVAVYITGTWMFHLESIDGTQVSESFPVTIDENARSWYFFRFQPG